MIVCSHGTGYDVEVLWIQLCVLIAGLKCSPSPAPPPFSATAMLGACQVRPLQKLSSTIIFFSTSPLYRDKEAGWGGRTRSMVILWEGQRLAH